MLIWLDDTAGEPSPTRASRGFTLRTKRVLVYMNDDGTPVIVENGERTVRKGYA